MSLHHISITAEDLEASIEFYTGVFGMERIPSPDSHEPVALLLLGDQALEISAREALAPEYRQFGLHVDDYDAVHRKLREVGSLDRHSLYVRDPAGNLVEVLRNGADRAR